MFIPSPKSVLKLLQGEQGLIAAQEQIKANLTDPDWVRTHAMGKDSDLTFHWAFKGSVDRSEKAFLIDAYKEAGWGAVRVFNSDEEVGETPTWGITLSVEPLDTPELKHTLDQEDWS